jgi:hypothetical protein
MNQSKKIFGIAFMVICVALAVAPDSSAQRNSDPGQFLAAHEPELQQPIPVARKLYLLTALAPAALAAKNFAKARTYAEELMALGKSEQGQPGFGPSIYGNSTHVGNVVLGKLALINGDLTSANEHLLAAARISGSPTLSSFGPDMQLAKELIERGQLEVAISYFDLCAKFWTNERGRLQQWKDAVAKGSVPDFGPNLGYIFNSWQFAK